MGTGEVILCGFPNNGVLRIPLQGVRRLCACTIGLLGDDQEISEFRNAVSSKPIASLQHRSDNALRVTRTTSIEVIIVLTNRQHRRHGIDVRAEHDVRLACECDDIKPIVSYVLALDVVAQTCKMRFDKLADFSLRS